MNFRSQSERVMEAVNKLLLRKYFSNVGYFVLNLQLLAFSFFFVTTIILSGKERHSFSCQSDIYLHDCLMRYDEQYTPLPLYGFAALCFVQSVLMCIT